MNLATVATVIPTAMAIFAIVGGLYFLVRNQWTCRTLCDNYELVAEFTSKTGMDITSFGLYNYVLFRRFMVWDINKILDHKAYNLKHKPRDLP